MADIDTSSYPKPAPAAQSKSFLDQAKQYGDIEAQNISISQQKLKLMNDQFQVMNDELSVLADPEGNGGKPYTKEQAAKRLVTISKTLGFKPEITNHMLGELNEAKDVPTFARAAGLRGLDSLNRINKLYANPGFVGNGQTNTPVVTSNMINQGAPKPVGAPIQTQAPPSQQQVDNRRTLPDGTPNPNFGQTLYLGPQTPQIPAGTKPVQGGLPGQYEEIPVQRVPTERIRGNPANAGWTPDWVKNNDVVSNRFPSGGASALPPGVGEAATNAGAASGQVLANERSAASNFQRDIFPLQKAIPGLSQLGTKGTGPGTETINDIKSFILSNIPGIKESDPKFNNIKTYDEVKKYLTDFVNQTGNSGTNDKLAAAFAGNPSVKISNAAASDVAKAAMALRRMKQSRYLSFEDSGLQPDQASQFFANGLIKFVGNDGKEKSIRTNQLDARAFGVDMMDDKAKKKLLTELNSNPREKELFEKSLEIAIQHGYLTPK